MADISDLPPPAALAPRPPGIKSMTDIAVEPPAPPKSQPSEPKPEEDKPASSSSPLESEKPRGEIEDDFSLSEEVKPKETPKEKEKPKSKEDNMRELARSRDEAVAQRQQAEARLKELEEQHKAKLAELEGIVEKTAFESSPKFKKSYVTPVEEAANAVKAFVEEMGEDASVAEKLLSLKGKERIEYLDATFGTTTASAELLRLATIYGEKTKARDAAIVNYKQTREQFSQQEIEHSAKEERRLEDNFNRVLEKLTPKVSLLRKIDGDVEHNNRVDEMVQTARAIMMGKASEEDMLTAPFLAVAAKMYMKRNKELLAELQKYKSRVKEEGELEPGISTPPISPTKPKRKPAGMMAVIPSVE